MRLICLNVWEGIVWPELNDFIIRECADTDIFCFQEVFHSPHGPDNYNKSKLNLYDTLQKLLSDFQGIFAPTFAGTTTVPYEKIPVQKGLATFVKSAIPIISNKTEFVYRSYNDRIINEPTTNPRLVLTATIKTPAGPTNICNFHGIWWPGEKTDNPERLKEAAKVCKVLDALKGRTIICGDFNLLPTTQSMHIIEQDMINLITKYNITSTRSSYFAYPNKFADYILITPDITINKFAVLPDEVSDHLPLVLEFD